MKIPNLSFLIVLKKRTVNTSSAPYFLTMEDPLVTFETTSKGKLQWFETATTTPM